MSQLARIYCGIIFRVKNSLLGGGAGRSLTNRVIENAKGEMAKEEDR